MLTPRYSSFQQYPFTRVQKGTTMHKISLPTTALGLALLASSAYADDQCTPSPKTDASTIPKDIVSVAKDLGALFTSISTGNFNLSTFATVSDVKDKVQGLLDGNESGPLTLAQAQCENKQHFDEVIDAVKDALTQSQLEIAHEKFQFSWNDFISNEIQTYNKLDDDDSTGPIYKMTYSGTANITFTRGNDVTKDQNLWNFLNANCIYSDSKKVNQKGGCVYNLGDLYGMLDKGNAVKSTGVYDWQLGLPSLLLFIAQRFQIMAAMHPEFFINPDTTYIGTSPYPASAGCATAAGSRRTRLAPPGKMPVFS
jgi:hypothetical protein